jgi:hypothetical protein
MDKAKVASELLKLAKALTAMEFDTKESLEQYKKNHDVRPGTKLTVKKTPNVEKSVAQKGGLFHGQHEEFKKLEGMSEETKKKYVDEMVESKGIDKTLSHFNALYKALDDNNAGMEDVSVVQEALNFANRHRKASISRCASPEVERAYQQKLSIVERQIELLQKNLDRDMSEFKKDSDNYGHVGNLGHVSEVLEEVNLFLK